VKTVDKRSRLKWHSNGYNYSHLSFITNY